MVDTCLLEHQAEFAEVCTEPIDDFGHEAVEEWSPIPDTPVVTPTALQRAAPLGPPSVPGTYLYICNEIQRWQLYKYVPGTSGYRY